MNAIGSQTYHAGRTPILPSAGQNLRLSGKPGAFDAIFADHATPAKEQGRETQNPAADDAIAPLDETEQAAQESETGSQADASDEGVGDQAGDQSPAEATAGQTFASAGQPVDGPNNRPPTEDAPTHDEQIRAELTHAAVVDLSALARREMLAVPGVEGIRPPPPPEPQQPVPAGEPKSGPAVNKGSAGSAERPDPGRLGQPTPIDSPQGPRIDPPKSESPGAQPAFPLGKQPTVGDPITASNVARNLPDGPGSGGQPPQAYLVGKSVFLDRLIVQSAGRRGAVAAPDRITAMQAESRSTPGRAMLETKPADHGGVSREAFLLPVQKGLARMLAQHGGQMTVLLRPERLGEVRIRMETGGGAVRVRMEAGTEAARSALEAEIDALRAGLESRGVRVDRLEVHRSPDGPGLSGENAHGSDPDAHPRRDGEHRPGTDEGRFDPHLPEPTGADAASVRGIWTEYGIDAVA